jgi:hypothetical protein
MNIGKTLAIVAAIAMGMASFVVPSLIQTASAIIREN